LTVASLVSILQILAPLLTQLSSIVTQAIAANATNDQATLDALDKQARAMADALAPR
jgi:hypothetical protein